MNLTICLLVSRAFIPKEQIRQAVEGYHDLTDEAFDRMFDRDKEELRVLGVPIELGSIEKGFDDEVGYRIRRDPASSCPRSASRPTRQRSWVWQPGSGSTPAWPRPRRRGCASCVPAESSVDESALTIIEPALATDEPAFDAIFDAVTQRTPISFEHRSSSAPRAADPSRRAVGDRVLARPLVRRRA